MNSKNLPFAESPFEMGKKKEYSLFSLKVFLSDFLPSFLHYVLDLFSDTKIVEFTYIQVYETYYFKESGKIFSKYL